MILIDKIILTTKDVQALLKWRDEHKDLVRKMPAPFKVIEMQFPQTKINVKGFRNEDKLKLQVSRKGLPLGYVGFTILPTGIVISKGNKSKLRDDEAQDCLTVYCSLMALIAYARPEERSVTEETLTSKPTAVNVNKSKHLKKGMSVTYLLSKATEVRRQAAKRERRSPKYAYSVRGHFRHYKSGKVIWVEQHIRGDKEKKSKTYKLGKGVE